MSHPSEILDQLGARPLKRLSQNFLTSPHWVNKLTDAVCSIEADELWEIGPGLGALTDSILKKSKIPVRLFEFDKKLAADLAQRLPQTPIEMGDVLQADFEKIASGKRIAVLSNLPYHLSSPILFKFLESKVDWQGFVLTFQREYAERLTAQARTKDYGSLSVVFQWNFESERVGIVPPGAFYPVPKVDSMALKLWLRPAGTGSGSPYNAATARIVRTAFQYRRKTISNCLKGSVPKEPLAKALENIGFSLQARPEEISPPQFRQLAEQLAPWFSKGAPNGNQELA